jgi:TRAP-type C4-dicarboxylate transport system permease small subunit
MDSNIENKKESAWKIVYFAERLFSRCEFWLAFLGGIFLVFLTGVLNYEVVQRKLFNRSLLGIDEILELAMIPVAFLAIILIQRDEGHLKVDLLYDKIIKTKAGPLYRRAISAISLIFFIFFLVSSSQFVFNMILAGESTHVLRINKAYFYVAIPLSCIFCILRLLFQVFRPDKSNESP